MYKKQCDYEFDLEKSDYKKRQTIIKNTVPKNPHHSLCKNSTQMSLNHTLRSFSHLLQFPIQSDVPPFFFNTSYVQQGIWHQIEDFLIVTSKRMYGLRVVYGKGYVSARVCGINVGICVANRFVSAMWFCANS